LKTLQKVCPETSVINHKYTLYITSRKSQDHVFTFLLIQSMNNLGRMLANNGRCTCEIKLGLLWQRRHVTRRGLCLLVHWMWNWGRDQYNATFGAQLYMVLERGRFGQ
jgi:hypothetical protein